MTNKDLGTIFEAINDSIDDEFEMAIFGYTKTGKIFAMPPQWLENKNPLDIEQELAKMLYICSVDPDDAEEEHEMIAKVIESAIIDAAMLILKNDNDAMMKALSLLLEQYKDIIKQQD